LDGIDLVFGMGSGAFGDDATPRPLRAAASTAQDEIDALLAVVPGPWRANAQWAIPMLLDAARTGGISHPRRIAYVLATAQHAAHFGASLEEHGGGPIRDGVDRSFERYEPGSRLGNVLGNTQPGDGERFRGRGFIHVRGRAAYAAWSQRLAMPEQVVDAAAVPYFIAYPAALAQPNVAAQTLVRGMRDGLFTGFALGAYVNDRKTDFYGARKVVGRCEHARDVAETAAAFAAAIDDVQSDRHRAQMQRRALDRAPAAGRDLLAEVRHAVARRAACGQTMPEPLAVLEWDGEARQGKFIALDAQTMVLHVGRGAYIRLDVQRDLNGVTPPEGCNMALKRSGDVRLAARHGELNSWR
jgi:hypothetical protein